MQKMKNMLGDGFMEFLKPSIKTHQNENVLKMLELAKDKPESLIELLSVAIFHHNIPIIKQIIEKLNLTENDSPYINALNFHNSIFPDNSPYKLTDSKESFIEVQIPFILMAGIGGHIDIFEKLVNHKLISSKKISGAIGLSKKNKNILISNVIGACAFYGRYKLLDFILKNYKDELDIGFITTEKKAKNNKMGFLKEYSGYTPAFLAMVGPTEDKDTLEVLKILHQYNAKFDMSNSNKDNILHLATKNKKFECAKYICEELGLKNLANEINKKGYSPLSLAQHLNEEKFISYFHDMDQENEKEIEKNLKELLAESVNKETKKIKKKKGKKKGKNTNEINNDIPGYLGSSDYQETLKEIVPKKSDEENNKNKLHDLFNAPSTKKEKKKKNESNNNDNTNRKESIEEEKEEEIREDSKEKENKNTKKDSKQKQEDNFIIGLSFKNNKKNKKLKIGDKRKQETNTKKESSIQNKEPEPESNSINKIEQEPEKIQAPIPEKEPEQTKKIPEQNEDIKKEKKIKPKKTKKEKRKDKESTDDFIEQMRKREKEKQELKRQEEERKRKEQEEKEQREKEEQQRILEEERLRKEQEEKQRLEELKKLEEEKLKQEEENRKKEEEEEKSDKDVLSYSEEENNNINNLSEEKEEEKEIEVSMEDYEKLNKNYLELEKRLSNLEQEKTQLTSLLTKLYLENKSKGELVPNSSEENINDLMYLANKELANKNEIINDLENKLAMLDLTNINHFSIEKLKKFKDFYSKNLQIINDAMK